MGFKLSYNEQSFKRGQKLVFKFFFSSVAVCLLVTEISSQVLSVLIQSVLYQEIRSDIKWLPSSHPVLQCSSLTVGEITVNLVTKCPVFSVTCLFTFF